MIHAWACGQATILLPKRSALCGLSGTGRNMSDVGRTLPGRGLGPHGNIMAFAVPEDIPERMEIISYASELAFLHDGTPVPSGHGST